MRTLHFSRRYLSLSNSSSTRTCVENYLDSIILPRILTPFEFTLLANFLFSRTGVTTANMCVMLHTLFKYGCKEAKSVDPCPIMDQALDLVDVRSVPEDNIRVQRLKVQSQLSPLHGTRFRVIIATYVMRQLMLLEWKFGGRRRRSTIEMKKTHSMRIQYITMRLLHLLVGGSW